MREAQIADRNSRLKEPLLPLRALLQFGLDRRVDAFVDARHRNQHGRPLAQEVFAQQRHRAREYHARTGHHGQVITAGALKHMRQRQKRKEHISGADGHHSEAGVGIAHDVAVTEHHPLRFACGTRGIDDGRQRIRVGGQMTCRATVFGEPLRNRSQTRFVNRLCQRLDDEDTHQTTQLLAQAGKALPLLERAEDDDLATGIVEDVGDIVRPVLRVERHHHQAEAECCLIEHHPFGRIAHHHGDTVASLQTIAFQRRLPTRHLAINLRPTVVTPIGKVLIEIAVRQRLRRTLYAFAQQPVECARLFRRDRLIGIHQPPPSCLLLPAAVISAPTPRN